MAKIRYLIGIDEVGRGCLAGPVAVAAVAVPADFKFSPKEDPPLAENVKSKKLKVSLKDSKKLSAKQREEWALYIKNHPGIFYETAYVYPKAIERINISQAANLAATRAVERLCSKLEVRGVRDAKVLLDGGLYLQDKSNFEHFQPRTVIRADEKFNCVKMASIIAKVSRDRAMRRLHKKFPEYGLDEHKGYGTKQHILAIKKHGPAPIHRSAFLRGILA